jgi:hypothetical protein
VTQCRWPVRERRDLPTKRTAKPYDSDFLQFLAIGLNDRIDEVCGSDVDGYDAVKGHAGSCDDVLDSYFDSGCYVGGCLSFVTCDDLYIVVVGVGRVIATRLCCATCNDGIRVGATCWC